MTASKATWLLAMVDSLVYLHDFTLVSHLDPLGNLCLDVFQTNNLT